MLEGVEFGREGPDQSVWFSMFGMKLSFAWPSLCISLAPLIKNPNTCVCTVEDSRHVYVMIGGVPFELSLGGPSPVQKIGEWVGGPNPCAGLRFPPLRFAWGLIVTWPFLAKMEWWILAFLRNPEGWCWQSGPNTTNRAMEMVIPTRFTNCLGERPRRLQRFGMARGPIGTPMNTPTKCSDQAWVYEDWLLWPQSVVTSQMLASLKQLSLSHDLGILWL